MAQPTLDRRSFCRLAMAGAIGAALPLRYGWAQSTAKPKAITLEDVNRMDESTFGATFGDTFELSPWVAKKTYAKRPFATVAALHQAMWDTFETAPRAERITFFRNLPDIGDKNVKPGGITENSKREQQAAGINALNEQDLARLIVLNKAYKAKFGYGYTICVLRNTPETIMSQIERRMTYDPDKDLAASMQEEFYITRLRVAGMVTGPGMPKVNGNMNTHVLNAVSGKPAEGMSVELYELMGDTRRKLNQQTIDADGRCMLMDGRPVPIGRYEIRFGLADYFRKSGVAVGDPAYLDVVPVRISIANPEDRYQVPLVCTPWSYSTYRGT